MSFSYTTKVLNFNRDGIGDASFTISSHEPRDVVPLWPLVNPSFELSGSVGGWYEVDPAGVVGTTSTSSYEITFGTRALRLQGPGGTMKQALLQASRGQSLRSLRMGLGPRHNRSRGCRRGVPT